MSRAPGHFGLHRHKDGFLEVSPKPSSRLLQEYYNNEYFNAGTYSKAYSEIELEHKYLVFKEAENVIKMKAGAMLDIGCGEGFSLNYFKSRNWDVAGIDFTADGVGFHFPELKNKLVVGDIFHALDALILEKKTFDFIFCTNVIEHVLEPGLLLEKIKKLCNHQTICRLQVPNDNSWLQTLIVSSGLAEEKYWFCPPAHLSYFDTVIFENYLESKGFTVFDTLGDFPIELFLLNDSSNYKKKSSLGKLAHKARIDFDVNLSRVSIEKLVAFRRGCGVSGCGRNTIAYCRLTN